MTACPVWCTNCTASAPSGEHRSVAVQVVAGLRLVASVYVAQRPGGEAGVVVQHLPQELFDVDACDRLAAAVSRTAALLRGSRRGRVLDR